MAASAACAPAGWWLGESAGFPPPFVEVLLAIVIGSALGFATSGPGAVRRSIGSMLVLGALTVGYLGGGRSSEVAWNDCVHRREDVRAALAQYRQDRGGFPLDLSQLPGGSTCGNRPMRGTILRYERRADEGYVLSFGDSLAVHEATDEAPFSSHK